MDTNKQTTPQQPLLQWTAPTHPAHERTWRWYAIAGAIAGSLLIYSIATKAWSFTVVIVAMSVVIVLGHRHGPQRKTIQIFEHGFTFDRQFTAWQSCSGFWLLQGPDYVELHIERLQGPVKDVCIQTGTEDYRDVFAALSRVLPYFDDRREHLLDNFARNLKI